MLHHFYNKLIKDLKIKIKLYKIMNEKYLYEKQNHF